MPIPNSFAAGSARAFGFLGSISPSDPYFNYVTMLLPGNGTNGAQNNTFLDSSTNNFTITRNGNTTQGTLSPYGSNWSNYFNGGANYLVVAAASAIDLASSDFTIECWVFPLAQTNSVDSVFGYGAFGTMLYRSGTTWTWEVGNGSSNYFTITANFTANTWQHIALTRSGNIFTFWLNGVSQGTNSTSGAVGTASRGITIGHNGTAAAQYFTGYISNFRLVKGTALYTANFTPPTAPLTAITNTSLLTCQSNRFRDASSNNFTITRNGDVSVQRFSPFNPTASYAPSIDGGSGYFDGNGDYLAGIGTTSSFNFMHQSNALFTVEAWIYPTVAQESTIIDNTNGTSNQTGVIFYMKADRTLRFFISRSASSSWVVDGTTTGTVNLNSWNHVVATYDQSQASNNLNLYINGVNAGTASKTGNTPASGNASNPMAAGALVSGALYLVGNLSDVRITNSIVYTSAFTPPTAPLTAISGTSLLLSMTNAGIIDNTEMNNLETVGNAQISTAQSKFGGGSMAFDGTGDWLVAAATPNNRINTTGNFTIEMWVYFNTVAADQRLIAWDNNANNFVIAFYTSSPGNLAYYLSSSGTAWNIAQNISMGSVAANTWYHIALVRSGNVFTPYINGVAGTTTTNSSALFSSTLPFLIGAVGNGGSPFNGYIDDLRITNGYARYTANFTPPAAPFPTK